MPKGIYERKIQPIEERFWEKVDIKGPEDCWEWTSSKDKDGYGDFRNNRKERKVHRFSWFLHYGEIPEGLLVCHHCDNPSCVNPTHLFMGTQKDNIQDALAKGRLKSPGLKGEAHGRAKLTEEQVLSIRTSGRSEADLARKYNVDRKAIWNIKNHITWTHI